MNFAPRIKDGTRIECLVDRYSAADLASRGRTRFWESVKVTTDGKASHRVKLMAVRDRDQDESWLSFTDLTGAEKALEIYANRL